MIGEGLPAARPELPDALSDRQQYDAEPLLAIADATGGDWPQAARFALAELCGEAEAQLKSQNLTQTENSDHRRLAAVAA